MENKKHAGGSMIGSFSLKLLSVFLVFVTTAADIHAQVNIIFDTDMGSDCDDAGALAVLHKLADLGEAKILGVMFSSGRVKYGVGVCDAINTYYGRGDLPLGQYKGDDVGDPRSLYSVQVAANVKLYRHDVIDSAPEIIVTYKELLQRQPDKSVTIVTVGHPNALFHLIQDPKGFKLVKQKVRRWVAMAGADTLFKRDWNFGRNGAETCIMALLKEWPTPMYIAGGGKYVITGNKKLPSVPEDNPVKQIYRLWKNSLVNGRSSPDQLAVLFAVRPQYFNVDDKGSLEQDSTCQTRWNPAVDNKKQHKVKPLLSNGELEIMIEDLMAAPPGPRPEGHGE